MMNSRLPGELRGRVALAGGGGGGERVAAEAARGVCVILDALCRARGAAALRFRCCADEKPKSDRLSYSRLLQ
jgi:hypothetical protein